MSLIIVATDFSAVGENAVSYACGLATAQNAELIIVHTFIMPIMFSDIAMPNNLINEEQNEAEAQIKQVVKEVTDTCPNIVVKGKVVYGDVMDALDEYTKQNINPWLVVIGNNNANDTISFDSTLLETFKNSKYPVLAIPSSATFKPVKKICFAFDNKYAGSDVALLQLRDLKQQLHAELHVLYAAADVPNRDNIADIDATTKEILAPASPQYHFRYDTNIENAIKTFAEENNIDWLVVMPRKHSFVESIFHKSHTKAMAHSANIPIVALHENLQ